MYQTRIKLTSNRLFESVSILWQKSGQVLLNPIIFCRIHYRIYFELVSFGRGNKDDNDDDNDHHQHVRKTLTLDAAGIARHKCIILTCEQLSNKSYMGLAFGEKIHTHIIHTNTHHFILVGGSLVDHAGLSVCGILPTQIRKDT